MQNKKPDKKPKSFNKKLMKQHFIGVDDWEFECEDCGFISSIGGLCPVCDMKSLGEWDDQKKKKNENNNSHKSSSN